MKEFGGEEREVRIPSGEVRIGRDPEVEVVLHDLGVSRLHARILHEDERFLLEDLGSRNGTRVNRQVLPSMGSRPLSHGDIIQVGRSVLRFLAGISKRITSSWRRNSATPIGLPHPTGGQAPAERAPAAARGERPPAAEADEPPMCLFRMRKIGAWLIVAPHGKPAMRYPLNSDRVRIGSDPASDIVLDYPGVSPQHAEIVYNREGFHLVDRESEGGSFVDGAAAALSRIVDGSFIRLGKVEVLFSVREEGHEVPVASFDLRDHLLEVFPDRREAIQKAFRDSRETGVDLGEELVLRRILSPAEWWAMRSERRRKDAAGGRSWWSRLMGGRGSSGGRGTGTPDGSGA